MRVIIRFLSLGLLFGLTACSFVADLFPDKQKQYRYSSELPPLEIPPDLSSSTIDEAQESKSSEGDESRTNGEAAPSGMEESETRTDTDSAADKSEQPKAKASVPVATLAQSSDDVPLIEVEAPFAETWNDVSRAVGRLELEVSDQNQSEGTFFVYYGGDAKKPEDGGLWQSITSVFTGGGDKGLEFRIKLVDKGETTHVWVLNSEGKAVSEGKGVELLKRLHETLQKLDQPEPESQKLAPSEENP